MILFVSFTKTDIIGKKVSYLFTFHQIFENRFLPKCEEQGKMLLKKLNFSRATDIVIVVDTHLVHQHLDFHNLFFLTCESLVMGA